MLIDRFLKYVQFDTQSDPNSATMPSTAKQKQLAEFLVKELHDLKIENAHMDEYGYVYAHIKGNNEKAQKVGFLAHMDTSFDFSGKNVKVSIIENYDGKDIILNQELVTSAKTFPWLKDLKGKTLITTDGTTLLGADNKAGIAEIMTLIEYLMNNDLNHGDISIAFTPDEEIGKGASKFNLEKFNADFAYTVDGGKAGSIEYENFNAASTKVTINGVSIHPGDSKFKMINAINVGYEFHNLLNQQMRPENTEGYEGFYHLHTIEGDVSKTELNYIIRNHDKEQFEFQKAQLLQAQKFINQKYQKDLVTVETVDTYYNMADKLADDMYIIEIAEAAIKKTGLTPESLPIRGGTDGAVLTYMGLKTPNLGVGGYNFHGPHELAVVEEMYQSVEILKNIVKIIGEK